MNKVCEIFESLNLKIISANITSVCGSLLHTLFVESGEMSCVQLKEKIEAAIASYDALAYPYESHEPLMKNESKVISEVIAISRPTNLMPREI